VWKTITCRAWIEAARARRDRPGLADGLARILGDLVGADDPGAGKRAIRRRPCPREPRPPCPGASPAEGSRPLGAQASKASPAAQEILPRSGSRCENKVIQNN
jgi:hypothetical protein